jgi:hypothetical protein
MDPGRTLARRPDEALPLANEDELAGQPLLLDTCAYIDQMQGRTPRLVEQLVEIRQVNHSTVAIQELMHTLGVLNPNDRRTAAVVAAVATTGCKSLTERYIALEVWKYEKCFGHLPPGFTPPGAAIAAPAAQPRVCGQQAACCDSAPVATSAARTSMLRSSWALRRMLARRAYANMR